MQPTVSVANVSIQTIDIFHDSMTFRPKDNVEAVLAWMIENFERSYKGNRAPFGVYMHAGWFWRGDSHLAAYGKYVFHLHFR